MSINLSEYINNYRGTETKIQGAELIEMDSSLPKVRLVVHRAVNIGNKGETELSVS